MGVDGEGNALVVWSRYDGLRYNVYANRFSIDAGTWVSAALIEASLGNAYAPRIAVNSAGYAVALWVQADTSTQNAWANTFTPDTGWATATKLEFDDTGEVYPDMDVAIDQTGNSVVVWTQAMGNINLVTARYSMDAGWSDAGVAESLAYQVDGPKVAFRSDGSWVLVWSQSDGTGDRIWASFCSR